MHLCLVESKFTIIHDLSQRPLKKKYPFLILKRWINNSKEKFKVICDKNKDHIEYHKNDVKMQEMPLERN